MKDEIILGAIGTGASAVGTAVQTNEVLQTISLIITIVGGLITFIIVPVFTWWKKAKSDGKITTDEIKEGVDTIKDGVNNLNDKLNGKDDEK